MLPFDLWATSNLLLFFAHLYFQLPVSPVPFLFLFDCPLKLFFKAGGANFFWRATHTFKIRRYPTVTFGSLVGRCCSNLTIVRNSCLWRYIYMCFIRLKFAEVIFFPSSAMNIGCFRFCSSRLANPFPKYLGLISSFSSSSFLKKAYIDIILFLILFFRISSFPMFAWLFFFFFGTVIKACAVRRTVWCLQGRNNSLTSFIQFLMTLLISPQILISLMLLDGNSMSSWSPGELVFAKWLVWEAAGCVSLTGVC